MRIGRVQSSAESWAGLIEGISLASGFPRENTSINWNIENDYSSLSRAQNPEQILTSTGGRTKNQITNLSMRPLDNLIRQDRRKEAVMTNIPELANESRFSDNFSQGGIGLNGEHHFTNSYPI